MAEFLTTSGTAHHVENIIIDAKDHLTLVSPYLKLSKTLFERLKDASGRGVKIKIIYGKDELKPNEKNSLAELKSDLLFFENLHAKCYFNDNKMVITSMNMYEFSEKTNREMGVLIDKQTDRQLYEKAFAEVQSIIKSAEIIPNTKVERKFAVNEQKNPNKSNFAPAVGYCIRCEGRINFDPSKPYCPNCYSVWAEYGNKLYEESVCHCCGEFEVTTMEKPVCYSCFRKLNKSDIHIK
jgi:hypothetical protein